MAGYNGYSKSNNAIEAEQEGKFPASVLAKKLKVKTEAIKEYLTPCEWHHTSNHFNQTDYYNGKLLLKIFNNEDPEEEGYSNEEIQECKNLLQRMKKYKKEINEKEYTADIEYIEWSGTRNHPKASVIKYNCINVTEKGSYYYFNINGSIIKKKIGSNSAKVMRNIKVK